MDRWGWRLGWLLALGDKVDLVGGGTTRQRTRSKRSSSSRSRTEKEAMGQRAKARHRTASPTDTDGLRQLTPASPLALLALRPSPDRDIAVRREAPSRRALSCLAAPRTRTRPPSPRGCAQRGDWILNSLISELVLSERAPTHLGPSAECVVLCCSARVRTTPTHRAGVWRETQRGAKAWIVAWGQHPAEPTVWAP